MPDASGIRKGDPVQMRGVNIGRILGFTILQQGVEMRLEIEGEYPIPKDSRVEIKASGLLGGMVADVVPGTSPQRATGGDTLPGRDRRRASSTRWTRSPARPTRSPSASRAC